MHFREKIKFEFGYLRNIISLNRKKMVRNLRCYLLVIV